MDMLKKYFPKSFGMTDVAKLVITIIVYLVIGIVLPAIAALVNVLLGGIPLIGAIVGIIVWVISSLIDLYVLVGIVLAVLDFCKVLK